mgnify:CR=1 FL=1
MKQYIMVNCRIPAPTSPSEVTLKRDEGGLLITEGYVGQSPTADFKWPCKSDIYKAILVSSTKSSTKD